MRGMPTWDGELYRAIFPFPGLGSWDAEVYVALARAIGEPVLELGCGTGRILSALLAAGVDADGLELDPSMAAAGARRLASEGHAAARIKRGDMRTFALERKYALVVLPDNSLSLLHDDADVATTFARVRSHLRQNGEFVFDHVLLDRAPAHHAWPTRDVDVDGTPLRAETSGVYDADARIYTLTIVATDGGGARRSMELALRQRSPEEILELLRASGFSPRVPPSDERGRPVDAQSHLMIGRFF